MEFHSESMKQMTMPDLSVMMDVASKLGVSTTALKNEMDSVEVSNQLDKVREMAQGLVINATPTLILGNEAISGVIPLEQLQAKIAKLREKKS